MALEWYIDAGGQIEGPVSADELRARAAGGGLAPTDSVSADRVTWVPANTVPGLTFPARPRQPLLETVASGSVQVVGARPKIGAGAVTDVVVPGYTILDTLGAGACGVVYKALQEKLNRVLALKTVLMPEKAAPDLLSRFQQEARSLAKLHHPNIVAVYDSGQCETPSGQAYFAMELLDGEDLGARLERAGPVPEQTAWLIARQTAAALAHAVKHGIIHRDVKPANLFLVTPPTGFQLPPGVPMVKVTDFGLALSRGEGDQRRSVAGTLLGTPVYMAPEQFVGSDVDASADIYGLGCTVYHALTGAPPFDGRTIWDVMRKKSAPAPRLAPPISEETADLVAAMLAISPDDRPRDYTELLARIDALPCMDTGQCSVRLPTVSGRMPVAEPPEQKPAPVPAPTTRRRWVYVVAAGLLLGAGAGLAIVAGAFSRPPEKPDDPEPPVEKVAPVRDLSQELYVSGSAARWVPDGAAWVIEEVSEDVGLAKITVLTGEGGVVRKFEAPARFSVVLNFDRHKADAVEVVVATADGPGDPTRWVVRVDRRHAVFGKRVGNGPLEPIGQAVVVPTPGELRKRGHRLYSAVKYERRDGKLIASFRDQPLGETADAGMKITELRVGAIGGPIRIDGAELVDLTPRK
jgi:eukaryotic-like serine/threonine-protein kinase